MSERTNAKQQWLPRPSLPRPTLDQRPWSTTMLPHATRPQPRPSRGTFPGVPNVPVKR